MSALIDDIRRLINLQQEGGYWDFKRQWHSNNGELLLDIICMANNLCNRDAYIIIGIDEEHDYEIHSVENDPNRKNTQNIVDFLRGQKFAGGVRPLVHVEQEYLEGGEIDVIIIENSYNTPFYLTERCDCVCPYHIYTRLMDSNTPRNKSAEINEVEYLWKKRFHIDETPLEKFSYYLKKPKAWSTSPLGLGSSKFYNYAPEFTVQTEYDDSRAGYEYYFFSQIDCRPNWYNVTLYYYQTAIEHFLGISLDGGRGFAIAPAIAWITLNENNHSDIDISYRYYEMNSLRFTLFQFFQNDVAEECHYTIKRFMECALFFISKNERTNFEEFVHLHRERYDELYAAQTSYGFAQFPNLEHYNMNEFKKDYRKALVLQEMLHEFRVQKNKSYMEDFTNADA